MSFDLSFKHYEEAGKEKLNSAPGFELYKFEVVGNSGEMVIEGSLTKIITRGKNKGKTKFLPEGRTKAVLSRYEVVSWCKKYEKETGKCAQCFGEGKLMKSWSAKDGTEYKPCDRCGGSGNSI